MSETETCGLCRDCNHATKREGVVYPRFHCHVENSVTSGMYVDDEFGCVLFEAKPVPESGVDLITRERQRQVTQKGYTPAHDATHTEGELAVAAAVWATLGTAAKVVHDGELPLWCWRGVMRGDELERVQQLALAGALCAAEIDRLQARDREVPGQNIDPGD